MQLLSWSWSPVVGHILADVPMLDTGASVLAHQGGWDEMLMVIVPVAAFAALLYGANRRAGRLGERSDGTTVDSSTGPDDLPPRAARPPEPRNERGGPI